MILKPSDDVGGLFVGGDQISRNLIRVVIVGANGAGKTWFVKRLAARLDLPVIHKDALALTTGWAQRPRTDVHAEILRLTAADAWVLEGGPSVLTAPVLARAQRVVWLDMPPFVRFCRVLWRSLRYLGRTRPELPHGNRDWPGLRQWRFALRALIGGARFTDAIEAALSSAQLPVVRLWTRADVALVLACL